jgi:hypothetical protein
MPVKKKAASKKTRGIAVAGSIPKLKLEFPLDDKKIAEIQRCLAKGKLTLTVSRVDLGAGRADDPWLYD